MERTPARTWRRTALWAAAMLVTGGVLAGAPAGATTAARTATPALLDPGMPAEVLAEYRQVYADVPVETLYQRLMLMPARTKLLSSWGAEHGDTFGGSWYDFRTGIWHILATTPAAAEAMAGPARAAGVTVRTRLVRYSMTALMRRADRIRGGKDPLSGISLAAGVDVPANRVKLEAPASRRTVRDPMVKYVDVSTRRPGPDHMCDSRRRCGRPLRTGVILWRGTYNVTTAGTGPQCSLGFVARGADGSRWALTAGHCVKTIPETWGHGDDVIGPVSAIAWCAVTVTGIDPTVPQCVDTHDTDVARIRITNDYWINGGFGYIFGNPEPYSPETLDIDEVATYRTDIEPGQVACLHSWHKNFIGFSTSDPAQWRVDNIDDCGTIDDPISTHYGMPNVVGAVTCPGDSGGGWVLFAGGGIRKAAGINKNGTEDQSGDGGFCSSGDEVWFTALDTVNRFFDKYSSTTIRVIHR